MKLEILYRGSAIATIEPGQRITLECAGKLMGGNIVIQEQQAILEQLTAPKISLLGHYIVVDEYDPATAELVVSNGVVDVGSIIPSKGVFDVYSLGYDLIGVSYDFTVRSQAPGYRDSEQSNRVTAYFSMISFIVDDSHNSNYTCPWGTLWGEWVLSEKNTMGFEIYNDYYIGKSSDSLLYDPDKGEFVNIYDVIQNMKAYAFKTIPTAESISRSAIQNKNEILRNKILV